MTPFITTAWTPLAGVLVLCLPGLAWLAFFWDPEQDTFERLAEAIGLSVALSALIALLAAMIGLQLTPGLVALVYILFASAGLITLRRWWRERTWGGDNSYSDNRESTHPESRTQTGFLNSIHTYGKLVYLILALVFLVVLMWRFHQIRDVVLPLWVDSVHHVQIVILFLENGGIPNSFEPYMPVPFYYHFAFHAVVALFSFVSRLSPQDAVLSLGQVLNAAIALSVYRLGKALWGDWRRAVLSALLLAFVTQMPAYYVTWGRYTLLTGMLMLPLIMASALDMINKGVNKSRLFTFGLLIAGILLTHYFAAALLAIFLVILGIQVLIQNLHNKSKPLWSTWLPMLVAALLGFAAASPWLIQMWGYARGGVEVVAIQPTTESINALYFPKYLEYLWRLLGPYRNQLLLFAALPGLVITVIRRGTRVFGVWTIILALLSLPIGFYVAPFRPDHAAIVLFLPTAMMIAELLVSIVDWRQFEKLAAAKIGFVLFITAILLGWGIYETRSVINSTTILADRNDVEALGWIGENTPPDSRFGINVTHWQYGSYRGVDGGWWITPLTGRLALLPNGLYGMGDREYVEQVNEVAGMFTQVSGCSPEFWDIVQSEGLTHLYLNASRGGIKPDDFIDCPGVEMIFQNQSVYLYKIEYIINPDSN